MRRAGVLLLALVAVWAAACGGGTGGAATHAKNAKTGTKTQTAASGGTSAASPSAAGTAGASQSPSASTATAKKLVPFKFSFDFTLNGFEAPFYTALKRGYYKRQGLAVQLIKGVSPADSIQWVATGKVDMTFDPWEEVIAADAKGAQLEVVAGLQEQSPFGLVYRSDHPIRQPSDLYSASIGVPAGSAAQISLQQFIAAAHLDASRIKISNTSPASQLGLLGRGNLTALAAGGYAFLPLATQHGIKVGYYPFSKLNVGATGENIVAPHSLVARHPSWVKGFLLATAEGFAYARAHPAKAVADEIAAAAAPLKATTSVQQLKLALKTLGSPNTKGKPWGWQSRRDWQRIIAQVKQFQGVKGTRAPSAYYTNALLPAGPVTAP